MLGGGEKVVLGSFGSLQRESLAKLAELLEATGGYVSMHAIKDQLAEKNTGKPLPHLHRKHQRPLTAVPVQVQW